MEGKNGVELSSVVRKNPAFNSMVVYDKRNMRVNGSLQIKSQAKDSVIL